MKISFFLTVLACLLLFAGYIFFRTWQLLPPRLGPRLVFGISYVLLWVTLFVGIVLDHRFNPAIGSVISFTGYTFLILATYFLLSIAVTDIVRWLLVLVRHSPPDVLAFRRTAALICLGLIVVVMVVGHVRFKHPELVQLDLTATKPLQHKSVKILMASDIHLGNSIGKKALKRYVDWINAQNPDLILLVGDVTDRSIKPVTEQRLHEELSQLSAKLGVYAVQGNHEYYSGQPDSLAHYLESAGIRVLRDETALIDSSFYLIGRNDRTNPRRRPLAQLVSGLDPSLPTIVMDHQPLHLEEASQQGIDLQLSGHTHEGQLFPGNLLVKQLFEVAYGYYLKGHTHVYVSSGLGLWGPQYRIGTQSELVSIQFRY